MRLDICAIIINLLPLDSVELSNREGLVENRLQCVRTTLSREMSSVVIFLDLFYHLFVNFDGGVTYWFKSITVAVMTSAVAVVTSVMQNNPTLLCKGRCQGCEKGE